MENNSIEMPEYLIEQLENGTLEDAIVLDKNGNWWHNGEPFKNRKIIDFFNKSIAKADDGIWVLQYDKYIYPITVEDVPIFITGVRFEGFSDFEKVIMNLSSGTEEILDVNTLVYRNSTLYCTVGNGEFPAKFMRSPAFHVLDRLDENNGHYYLTMCGRRIPLKQDG